MHNALLGNGGNDANRSCSASSFTVKLILCRTGRANILLFLVGIVSLIALLTLNVPGIITPATWLGSSHCKPGQIPADDIHWDQMDLSEDDAPKADPDLHPVDAFNKRLRSPTDLGSGIYWEIDTVDGELVWAGEVEGKPGIGYASLTSAFPLASLSKLYTAVAVMRTMQLKPDIFYPEKFLHEFKGWQSFRDFPVYNDHRLANLTIHHLLTHTSGLPFGLRYSKADIKRQTLFFYPGSFFGYTLGHRVLGWLLRDFWQDQPEAKNIGIKTVQDAYKWLIFDDLELSCSTRFQAVMEPVFGTEGDAGDASVTSSGEDLMKLAVLALRRGKLRNGTQFISEENWNKWAVPNLLPEGNLTKDLVSWQSAEANWLNWNFGDSKVKIMKQNGRYGWNYFGAVFPLDGPPNQTQMIGWCGFFSSCALVNYVQEVAFVMLQRDIADYKDSRAYAKGHLASMAESLQCKTASCSSVRNSSVFCHKCSGSSCSDQPWTRQCPWYSTRGKANIDDVFLNPKHHTCYKPSCRQPEAREENCREDSGGTCRVFGCDASRGNALCVSGFCLCQSGFCEQEGTCRPFPLEPTCCRDTGGTCNALKCQSSRHARCVQGKCLCNFGACAEAGHCVSASFDSERPCDINTVGTCKFLKCDSSRGPTDCIGAHCFCQDGYCNYKGRCQWRGSGPGHTCPRNTGGSCRIFGCDSSRKAQCVKGHCVCKVGFCSKKGRCYARKDRRQTFSNMTWS